MSIVDIVFPGFTGISAVVQQLLAGNLNSYTQLLCICGMLMFFGRYACRFLGDVVELVETHCIVSYSDEAHDMLLAWAVSQPFADKARSSLASVRRGRRGYGDDHPDSSENKTLSYSPWNGAFFFWYKNHLLVFRCREKEVRFSIEEAVSISCFGWSSAILKELLSECKDKYLKLVQNKTSVFEHREHRWVRTSTKDIRPIRTWYSQRGIPYRRGYLLYGPPGTGKSSLSGSIAGHFHLDIYSLSLSGVCEGDLKTLFGKLPGKCVVVLEDIDAVRTTRSRDGEEDKSGKGSKVSLSALLNVLDGFASQEGRLLVMTTNHIEKLDSALIRAGRVDMKIEFRLADKDMITQLFHLIYKQSEDDIPEKGKRIEADKTVERLAEAFVAKVPELQYSPAEVMSFLVVHKQSPKVALDNVDQWMDRIREERANVKRADSWVQEG
ncbi:putative mitochondrial chaperone bcs1 [Bombardia bombarda]|uniref:Mitochondrial chaperone bcs1 n=1 Tax=Bombardia bombarda TaxID=252184 RepID=A0AA40C779_9PEZI|nr:putative mitochondrial chaperone bcs1 [Bombardia bombarda]